MKKPRLYLLASVLLSLILIVILLFTLTARTGTGGGITMHSPDDQYVVHVNSMKSVNPFINELYAEVTLVKRETRKELKQIVIKPIEATSEMDYRMLKDPIHWSDDSKSVRVTTPDFEVYLEMP